MGWVKYEKGSFPERLGEYYIVKFYTGTKEMAFFKPIPPKKVIERMEYKMVMELEEEKCDRCIYRKHKAWFDKFGIEQKPEEILYWYKLDEMPQDEK